MDCFTSDFIRDYIKLDDTHAIFEVEIPKEWIGKNIRDIDIRRKYGINIMGIKENGDMNLSLTSDEIFKEQQTLLVLGEYKAIQKCFHI